MTEEEPSLRDAVTGMLISMSVGERASVVNALKQAEANPVAFTQYIIIQLGNLRSELDSVLYALQEAGVVRIEEKPDDPLSS